MTDKLTRCPCCKKPVNSTHFACVNVAVAGSVKSEAKATAARANGKKGGWHSWKKNRVPVETVKGVEA